MEAIGKAETSALARVQREASQLGRSRMPGSGPPRLMDQEVDCSLSRALWSNWIPSIGPRSIIRPLSKSERIAIMARVAELEIALEPFSGFEEGEAVLAAINGMFGSFPSASRHDADKTLLTAGSVRRFPAWAIELACVMIQRGDAGLDPRFEPSDAQLNKAVSTIVSPYRMVLDNAKALLSAPIEEAS